jgi:HD superfamily phosphohydrolase
MQRTVGVLRFKGVDITDEEENALCIAILLHDIGHGPFSHAMEHSIVEGVSHEDISILFMDRLNETFGGKLTLAIKIFRGEYHRKFMLQLISSQLDMDRMDYLKRDSFYSGVAEGNINSERLIQMFNVEDDKLVIEQKGIYSVEKFIVARRLMYWQAYLHKTSVAAELILTKILKRAREVTHSGQELTASEPLKFFIKNTINKEDFTPDVLKKFSYLDDFDILGAIKAWQFHDDFVLSELCKMIINRDLPKIRLQSEKASREEVHSLRERAMKTLGITEKEAKYFVLEGKVKNQAYNKEGEPIHILNKDRTVEDVIDASDQLNLKALSKPVTKYYVCFPKQLLEEAGI